MHVVNILRKYINIFPSEFLWQYRHIFQYCVKNIYLYRNIIMNHINLINLVPLRHLILIFTQYYIDRIPKEYDPTECNNMIEERE